MVFMPVVGGGVSVCEGVGDVEGMKHMVKCRDVGDGLGISFPEGRVEIGCVLTEEGIPAIRVLLGRKATSAVTEFLLTENGAAALATLLNIMLSRPPPHTPKTTARPTEASQARGAGADAAGGATTTMTPGASDSPVGSSAE